MPSRHVVGETYPDSLLAGGSMGVRNCNPLTVLQTRTPIVTRRLRRLVPLPPLRGAKPRRYYCDDVEGAREIHGQFHSMAGTIPCENIHEHCR